MAKLDYSLLEDFIKNEKEKYSPKITQTDQEKLQTQINNANTKLASQGLNTVDKDTRNAFEKATNLPENQHWFFDALDLLGRPQQALYGGLYSGLNDDGEDWWSGVKKGWSGERYLSGKDILTSDGAKKQAYKNIESMPQWMKDMPFYEFRPRLLMPGVKFKDEPVRYEDYLKSFFEDKKSNPEELAEIMSRPWYDYDKYVELGGYAGRNMDKVDIAGLLMDLFTDPMDLALFAVSAGGSSAATAAADAAKAVDKVHDASKVVSAVDNITDAAKVADTAADAAKVANTVDNVTDTVNAFNKVDNATDILNSANKVDNVSKTIKVRKSANDLLGELAGKAIKGAAGVTDDVVEKLLTKFDEMKGILYETPNAKSGNMGKIIKETLEDGTEVTKRAANGARKGSLETYKAIKEGAGILFDAAKELPEDILRAIRQEDVNRQVVDTRLRYVADNYTNSINEFVKDTFDDDMVKQYGKVENYAKQVDKDLLDLIEFENLDRTTTNLGLINELELGYTKAKSIGDDGFKRLDEFKDFVNKSTEGKPNAFNLSYDVDENGYIKLSGGWKKAANSVEFDEGFLTNQISKKGNYSAEAEKRLNKLKRTKNKGLKDLQKGIDSKEARFAKLYQNSEKIFGDLNNIVEDIYKIQPVDRYGKGYVRHAANNDYRDFMTSKGIQPESVFRGNTGVLSDRSWNMSVREANDIFTEKILNDVNNSTDEVKDYIKSVAGSDGLFKEGMKASINDYIENIPKNAADSARIDNILVKATFGNYDEIEEIEDQIKQLYKAGKTDEKAISALKAKRAELLDNSAVKVLRSYDQTLPVNFTRLSNDDIRNLANKLDEFGKQYGVDEMTELSKYLKKHKGTGSNKISNIAMQKDIVRLMEISTSNKTVKAFVELYDAWMNNFYKKWKVFSPTFQFNNVAGNMSNMYLAGISPMEMARLYPEAVEILADGPKLYTKALVEGTADFSSDQMKTYKIWKDMVDNGVNFDNGILAAELYAIPDEYIETIQKGKKASKSAVSKAIDYLPEMNSKMNGYFDSLSRTVTYLEGMENPSFLAKLGVNSPADAVRKVNFDPKDLTYFEKNVMKRVMPFYTFTKKNLAFQIDNISKNLSKYSRLKKVYNNMLNTATGGNTENVADYLKNNMYIPIPYLGEDGSYRFMRVSLPLGNFLEFTNDPFGSSMNMATPLLKAPYEFSTNTNLFNGLPIENFEGEKSKSMPFGITKKGEHLIGSLSGFDVPLKTGNRFYEGYMDAIEKGENGVAGGLTNMLTIEANIETDKTNKMYDQLEEVETAIKQYEQQGYEFSTINELKQAQSANKRAVNEVLAQYAKIHGNSYSKKDPYQTYLESLGTYSTTTESEDLWEYFGVK